MRQDKLGAIAGAQLIFYGNKKQKSFVRRGCNLITKTIILVIRGGTGIEMGNTKLYLKNYDLICDVQKACQTLLDKGHNYKFVPNANSDEEGRKTSMIKICEQIRKEAQKIVDMGYNAKFSCNDGRHE